MKARQGAARQADVAPNPTVVANGGTRAQLLGVGQELEYPGKRSARADAAAEDVEVSRAEFESARLDVEQEVAGLYFKVLGERKAIELLTENLSVSRTLLDAARSKLREGFGSNLDLVKAQVEVVRAQRLLRFAERDELSDLNKMKILLGMRSTDALSLKDVIARPLSLSSDNLDTLISIAFRQSPSLIAEQHKIKAAGYRREIAELASKPNFDFDLSGGIEEGEGTVELGLRIPISLWDTKSGAKTEAQYLLRSVEEGEVEIRNRIVGRVHSAFQAYHAAREAIALFQDSLLIDARQAAEAARTAYKTSGFRFLDLVDAQRTFLDVSLEYFSNLLTLRQAEIDLQISTGKSLQGTRP